MSRHSKYNHGLRKAVVTTLFSGFEGLGFIANPKKLVQLD